MGVLESPPHQSGPHHLQSGRLLEACAALIAEGYEKSDRLEEWNEARDGPMAHVPMGTARQKFLISEAGDALIVSMPGTTRLGDWAANLSVHYEPIDERNIGLAEGLKGPERARRLVELPCAHSGFLHRARTVPVRSLLQRAQRLGKGRIIFTGHSLGGSVAKIAALLMLMHQQRTGQQGQEQEEQPEGEEEPKQEQEQQQQQQQQQQQDNGGGNAGADEQPLRADPRHPFAVDVLCLAFAAPVCCNESLVQLVQSNGWKRRFFNVVIPEDYCLKLFNGVLQSAANPDWLASIQHALFREGHAFSGGLAALAAHAALQGGAGAAAAPAPAAAGPLAEPPVLGAPPVLKPFGGMRLALGLDGGSGGVRGLAEAGGRAVRFTEETASGSDSYLHAFDSSDGSCSGGTLDSSGPCQLRPADSLSSSYGGTFGSSGALCSTSSGDGSESEVGRSERSAGRGSGSGRGGSLYSSRSFASFSNLFMGERVAFGGPAAGAAAGSGADPTRDYSTGAGEEGAGAGGTGAARVASWAARRWPSLEGPEAADEAAPAALRPPHGRPITAKARAQLAAAVRAAARAARPRPGSWAAAALKAASWAVAASTTLLTAPLDVLEAWLVLALRPPPYRHCGHQLVLTHQGLRPQVAPLQVYNRHRGDAWNNRELALVVFREHSIVFYKRRIAALVGEAVSGQRVPAAGAEAGGGAATAAAAAAAAGAGEGAGAVA